MPYDFDRIIDRRNSNSIKWTHYPEDVLPMWVADMDFTAPEPVQKALMRAVEHGVFGYEMPGKPLIQSVVTRMKTLYDWDIDEKSVVPVTGLVSGFYAAANSLCRPGDGYLIQPPVYMPFNGIQPNLGFVRQEAPLTCTEDGQRLRYDIDWQNFEKAINSGASKTKMFLFCNPHNPTGQVYTREELLRMGDLCVKNNTVIVSDEIHSELTLGGKQHIPMATLSPEIARQSITLIAPSKTFNIAGLFCGFAIIPDHELCERYKRAVEHMTLHVSSLGAIAAQAAFSGECEDWLDELRTYLTGNREVLVDFVEENLPGVKITVPDATYLAWLDCSELNLKGGPYDFFLKNARVALNDGAAFGTGGENFVRLNFGCPREMLLEGLQRIQKATLQP
jgi:cystathionine beta-lyase